MTTLRSHLSLSNTTAMLAIVACLATPAGSRAELPDCDPTENWEQCFERLRDKAAEAANAAKKAADEAADAVADAETAKSRLERRLQGQLHGTGLSSLGQATARRGFIPGLFTAFGVDSFDDRDGALALVYNSRPLNVLPGRLSGELVLKQASVFDKLKKALPEDVRDEQIASFEEDLSDVDDIALKLVFTLTGSSTAPKGRFVAAYDGALSNAMFGEVTTAQAVQTTAVMNDLNSRIQAVAAAGGPSQLVNLKSSQGVKANQATKAAAASTVGHTVDLLATLEASEFFRIADLVANQPQLYFSLTGNERDEVVGTDSYAVSATWELPLAPNVNSLRRTCANPSQCTLAELKTFVTAKQSRIDSKDRILFSLTLGHEDAYDFAMLSPAVSLHLDSVDSVTASFGYGRSLIRDDEGKDLSRFDFETKYEDVSGDEQRNKRWTAIASLTERLNDDMSFVVSGVWANKPEYRGEVDSEWTARAGLRYKIDRKEED